MDGGPARSEVAGSGESTRGTAGHNAAGLSGKGVRAMVPNPGTKARASAIKPLNAPAPVTVKADERGMQMSVSGGGKVNQVVAIEDMWKINDEWWRGPEEEIARLYYTVRLENDQQLTVYLDLVANSWYRQAG